MDDVNKSTREPPNPLHGPPIVMIFDGICNLCTHSVLFVLKHEATPRILFTPVQSAAGERMLSGFGFSATDMSTFVLISGDRIYTKSSAAIEVAKHLRGLWKLLVAAWLIPRPIRDRLYDVVAQNRYRWFGKTAHCIVPAPQLMSRFHIE